MLDRVVGFVKGLFGGSEASLQIGNGQQSVSGSTTGNNSPMISAGGNVVYGVAVNDSGDETFKDLEQLVPDLLDKLKSVMREHPLFRDIVYQKKSTYKYKKRERHLLLAEDTFPDVGAKLRILEGQGLIDDVRGDTFHYRLTERFAKYLRR